MLCEGDSWQKHRKEDTDDRQEQKTEQASCFLRLYLQLLNCWISTFLTRLSFKIF